MAERLLEVGAIIRAHGLKGAVVVDLTTDRTERLNPGTVLETSRGTLTVRQAARHGTHFLVQFAEITDRDAAERWRRTTLLAAPINDDAAVWVDELFGAEVTTPDGVVRGRVVDVERHPTADLLVLDTGALVPMTFCVSVTPRERVVVDPPEGLFA